MTEKIDFVITWVDGNDPVWRRERDRYAALEHREAEGNSRYRDWETLRYWFRGVEKFTPWMNNIFFVTWGHVPAWLDTSHPKLKIVKHEDFIPSEFLPTYNSNVIEFHLHRIEGLSEQFVYFNDDFFLLGHVKPERFFQRGLPCDVGGMSVNLHSGMFGASVLLAKTLINDHFNKQAVVREHASNWFNLTCLKASLLNVACYLVRRNEFLGFSNPHLSQSILKETYREVWAKCEKDLVRTSKNRFRDYGDIAFWLIRYWQLASNRFASYNVMRGGQYFLMNDGNISEVADCIRRQRKSMVCLNDSDDISDFEAAKQEIVGAFEQILPEKCSFEL